MLKDSIILPITKIGDPYILRDNNKYYLYATSAADGFLVWESTDLINWTPPIKCYQKNENSFGDSKFWAPEVYKFENKYLMYYTANWKNHSKEALRIGLAIANSPLGPFEDLNKELPLFDLGRGALDGHVLIGYDKRKYLFFSSAGEDNIIAGEKYAHIEVLRLSDDGLQIEGAPKMLIKCELPYEKLNPELHQYWAEGPFVVKNNGKYHLMYSTNFFASEFYSICCAVSDNPTGPYIKYENNPILKKNKFISGPGHNSVVDDQKGNLYCIYHIHSDYNNPSKDRQVCITPMSFQNDRIILSSSKWRKFF